MTKARSALKALAMAAQKGAEKAGARRPGGSGGLKPGSPAGLEMVWGGEGLVGLNLIFWLPVSFFLFPFFVWGAGGEKLTYVSPVRPTQLRRRPQNQSMRRRMFWISA